MASSKLLTTAMSSSLRRFYRLASSPLLQPAPRRLPGPFFSARFCSAAAAAATKTAPEALDVAYSAVAAVSAGHPWPEWGDFLEKLRVKGYFERPPPPRSDAAKSAAGDGEVAAADPYVLRDQNRVKNACLKFARERFDLLSSLTKQDIQAIVESGCPNLFRKAVSSAKRLREFLQVDEGDACSVCKLRGSCDKAYVIPNAEEAARTVDVVRILLAYAIDPTSLSGENPVAGGVQESARKLLSDLTMLCDTTIDPSLPIPVFQTSSKKESSTKVGKGTQLHTKSRESAGKGRETAVTEMKKGDWLCPNCNFLNFARNRQCLECKEVGPKKIQADTTEMKMGDWICPGCNFMNFSRNKMCFKCEGHRPKRQLNPGEWECPSCDFVNFRRNQECKKCSHDRPEDDTQDNKLGYDVWRNTKGADKARSFDAQEDEDDERKHSASRRAPPAQRGFAGNRRKGDDGDDALPYEGERRHVSSRREAPARKGFRDDDDVEFDVSPYEGERKHVSSRRSAPARRTSVKDDGSEDDVLPYEGERKHVASRRASPSPRRFTAARGR